MEIEKLLQINPMQNRFEVLKEALRRAPKDGHILEFGVFKGDSINYMAGLSKGRRLTGFDSFEGLPEDWKRSEASTYKKGHFHLRGNLPMVNDNVSLVKGFFNRSLPPWMELQTVRTVALLHIDCDLYGGAKCVLTKLNDWIKPGTVIVFDELGNFNNGVYKDWQNGEWKALNEWLVENGRGVVPILRTHSHQAALEVTL